MNDIQCDVIKSFFSAIISDDSHYELRLVRWTVNGRTREPIFEKREYYVNKDGLKTNRCVGFKREDIWRIVTYLPVLTKLMDFPTPVTKDLIEKMTGQIGSAVK